MDSLPYLDHISNPDFILRHLVSNLPGILSSKFTVRWRALRQWVDRRTDGPNFEFLRARFGSDSVPILIGPEMHPTQMTFSSFIDGFFTVPSNNGKIAYLKDWHFQSAHPEEFDLYELPAFLRSDWANSEQWTTEEDSDRNPFGGDYRFVYFGTKGSWTPFHSDVLNSFSWSANVCGRKLWYLLRPGAERRVRGANDAYPKDIRECLGHFRTGELFEFVQEPGQIVFVPSGWWHQVHNLEESISINHNMINAFNLHHLVALMDRRLADVRAEILDVRELMTEDEFDRQCELLLLADCRMNRTNLLRLMELIIESRRKNAKIEDKDLLPPRDWPNFDNLSSTEISEWSQKKLTELSKKCKCEKNAAPCGQSLFCSPCAEFVRRFELVRASEVRKKLRSDRFLASNLHL
uniref:Jumonji domain-containing protein 4 n=1 Tax=Globodera rostochiensis TaxID=31243 RepID=A0A914HNI4_GLORO